MIPSNINEWIAFPSGATPVIRDENSAQNRRNMLVFIHNIGAMHSIHAVDTLTCWLLISRFRVKTLRLSTGESQARCVMFLFNHWFSILQSIIKFKVVSPGCLRSLTWSELHGASLKCCGNMVFLFNFPFYMEIYRFYKMNLDILGVLAIPGWFLSLILENKSNTLINNPLT